MTRCSAQPAASAHSVRCEPHGRRRRRHGRGGARGGLGRRGRQARGGVAFGRDGAAAQGRRGRQARGGLVFGRDGAAADDFAWPEASHPSKHLGWWLLGALRLVGAHVYFETPPVLRNGLGCGDGRGASSRRSRRATVSHSNGVARGRQVSRWGSQPSIRACTGSDAAGSCRWRRALLGARASATAQVCQHCHWQAAACLAGRSPDQPRPTSQIAAEHPATLRGSTHTHALRCIEGRSLCSTTRRGC
jgi:hypothetical protein